MVDNLAGVLDNDDGTERCPHQRPARLLTRPPVKIRVALHHDYSALQSCLEAGNFPSGGYLEAAGITLFAEAFSYLSFHNMKTSHASKIDEGNAFSIFATNSIAV